MRESHGFGARSVNHSITLSSMLTQLDSGLVLRQGTVGTLPAHQPSFDALPLCHSESKEKEEA